MILERNNVCSLRRVGSVVLWEQQSLGDGSHPFYAKLRHAEIMNAAYAERERLRAECRRSGIDPMDVWPPKQRDNYRA